MGKSYSTTEKVQALQALDANGGNMSVTATALKIPRRTLQWWVDFRDGVLAVFLEGEALANYQEWSPFWEDREAYVRPPNSPYPKTLEQANADIENTEDDETVQELIKVREQLMKGVTRLSKAIANGEGDEMLISYQAMAISRLIDRVKRLDEQIIAWRMLNKNNVMRINYEYVHGDGMVYDHPPYAFDDGDESAMSGDDVVDEGEYLDED